MAPNERTPDDPARKAHLYVRTQVTGTDAQLLHIGTLMGQLAQAVAEVGGEWRGDFNVDVLPEDDQRPPDDLRKLLLILKPNPPAKPPDSGGVKPPDTKPPDVKPPAK